MSSDVQGHEFEAPGLTVGRTAALVGVSVETLHRWDEIGLVRPRGRLGSGHRRYSGDDIARIHQVLVYRELGFPLPEISRILDDPGIDARTHLPAELRHRISRLESMLQGVDRALEAHSSGVTLTPEEQVEIFGRDWQPARIDKAEERCGDTAWAQYEDAAGMTPEEWKAVTASADALNADLGAAVRSGVPAGSPEADALAERHRALLSQHFHCTHSMHACIARMFVSDPRFTAYYETAAPGLAAWLHAAIFANARSHGVSPESATWQ